jgi:ClpP class serine protease
MDTNGGTREAGMVIENALNLRNKPVYSYVNVKSYSLGTYISSVCDGTFASHRKAGVGNIGIMTQIIDDSEWLKKYGIKEITIKPPESKFKNKEVEDAIKGNPEMLIKEYLSPLAQDFQNLVRNGYPNLDESVEGILEGKNFFAEDSHGLVQKVLSMEEMVSYALEQSELQNRLSGVFN